MGKGRRGKKSNKDDDKETKESVKEQKKRGRRKSIFLFLCGCFMGNGYSNHQMLDGPDIAPYERECSYQTDDSIPGPHYQPEHYRAQHASLTTVTRPQTYGRYSLRHNFVVPPEQPSFSIPQQPRQSFESYDLQALPLGSRARFRDHGIFCGGTVVWTGYRVEESSRHSLRNLLIVLRLEFEHEDARDGTFHGQQLIDEGTREKRYLMKEHRELEILAPRIGDYYAIVKEVPSGDGPRSYPSGFLRKIHNERCTLEPMNINYRTAVATESLTCPDYQLCRVPPPMTEEFSEDAAPFTGEEFDLFCGRNKGIQGRLNSCYLDTLIFSFFAFSAHLDDMLFESPAGKDDQYYSVLNTLRYQIVFPLRISHFVSWEHVQHLRRLIAQCTNNDSFLTETRDIPECMDALFGRILNVKPMLSIGRVFNNQAFFDNAYSTECLPMDTVNIPTTKQLLEHASVAMDFCFEKMPSCFVLQLPRESARTTMILPSYKLDLKNLIYGTVRVCHACHSNARLQFPHLINDASLEATFFCRDCALAHKLDLSTSVQLPEPRIEDVVDEDTEVTMSALICIEKSHYNCFVRCGSDATERWAFFDSMSDQERAYDLATDEEETFNIPLVEKVPNFRRWLKEAQESVDRHGGLEHFFARLDPEEKERAKRVFLCPYNVIYRAT